MVIFSQWIFIILFFSKMLRHCFEWDKKSPQILVMLFTSWWGKRHGSLHPTLVLVSTVWASMWIQTQHVTSWLWAEALRDLLDKQFDIQCWCSFYFSRLPRAKCSMMIGLPTGLWAFSGGQVQLWGVWKKAGQSFSLQGWEGWLSYLG